MHDPLRLSAAYWCYADAFASPAAFFAALAEAGYDAVEMVPPEHWPAARAAGLALLNLSGPGMVDGLNREGNHAALLPALHETIARARDGGVRQVIVFSGARDDGPADPRADAAGREHVAAALSALAPAAEAAGVTLAFEMLNSFDHARYEGDGSAYARAVVERVGSPAVKWLLDAYHLARMGESPVAAFSAAPAAVAHMHVARVADRGFPAPGDAPDYAALVRAARAGGYGGHWGMEFKPAPGEAPADALRRAADLFRSYAP